MPAVNPATGARTGSAVQVKRFRSTFGSGAKYREYTQADAARLKDRIPKVMRMILADDGWCSYRDQALWLCDPDDWDAPAHAWLPESKTVNVVGRSAFGELFVLDNTPFEVGGFRYPSVFWLVLPHYSSVLMSSDDPNWFFGRTLTDGEFMLHTDLPGMVKAAHSVVGPLEWDEIYTYNPALALGGHRWFVR